jgi:hypothetical protein
MAMLIVFVTPSQSSCFFRKYHSSECRCSWATKVFAFTPNVDKLVETLSHLDLPAAQLAAIRQTALEGKRQAIGWYASNLHFSRERLEMLGMSFRLPD